MFNFQSIGVHILGQEAMESKEESAMANGNINRCTSGYRVGRRCCFASYDDWDTHLCWRTCKLFSHVEL